MKTTLLVVLICLLSIAQVCAKSKRGRIGGAGNSGGAVVCRDVLNGNKVVYAAMYDNVEWSRLGIKESSTIPVDVLVKKILKKIRKANRWFANDLEKELNYFRKIINNFVRNYDVVLEKLTDSNHDYIPRNCPDGSLFKPKYEQVVNYRDKMVFGTQIKVSREIFAKFSEVSKASLYLHEAIYKIMREKYGHEDSEGSRALNAKMLAWGLDLISDKEAHSAMRMMFNDPFGKRYSTDTLKKKQFLDKIELALSKGKAAMLDGLLIKGIVVNGTVFKGSVGQIKVAKAKFLLRHLNSPLIKAGEKGELKLLEKLKLRRVLIAGELLAPSRKAVVQAFDKFQYVVLELPLEKAVKNGNKDEVVRLLHSSIDTSEGRLIVRAKAVNRAFGLLMSGYVDTFHRLTPHPRYSKRSERTRAKRAVRNSRDLKDRVELAKTFINNAGDRLILKDASLNRDYRVTPLMLVALTGDMHFAKMILSRSDATREFIHQTTKRAGRKSSTALDFAYNKYTKNKNMIALLKSYGLKHRKESIDCEGYYSHELVTYDRHREYTDRWEKAICFTLGLASIPRLIQYSVNKIWEYRAKKMMKYISFAKKAHKGKVSDVKIVKMFKKDFLSHRKVRWYLYGRTLKEKAKTLVKLIVKSNKSGKLCYRKRPPTMMRLRRMIRKGRLE